MGLLDYLKPIGTGNQMFPGLDKKVNEWAFGNPDQFHQIPTMTGGQQKGLRDVGNQIYQLGQGGYQDAMSLLQQYLDPQSDVYRNFEKPYLQQFEQQIVPGLAERFAGMGAMGGGLSSSGFGQSLGAAGANLQTQLAQMKQQYQRQSINDLLNQYNYLTGQYLGARPFENAYQPGSTGAFGGIASGLGTGIGFAAGGPLGAAAGSGIGNWFSNMFNPGG